MADFDVNTITAAGATLIASATAGNKLVIDGCDATTDVLTKAQAVQVSTRPASPGSNTTDVALAGSTDNHVYAYAEFIRGQSTGGDFNSFYLYGHIENAPSVIRVIAVASATASTHLPESGDVTNRSELQFELTFSATDEVVTVADSSMYATRGEVQVLRERVVTTHAEGSTTTGDNQTIYGQKTFVNDVSFSDGVTFSDDVTVVGDVGCKTVTPIAAGPYTPKIGDPDAVFREGYFGDVYLESITSLENNGNIVINSNLMPNAAKSVYIGSHMNPYKSIRSEEFMVCDTEGEFKTIVFDAGGPAITFTSSIQPDEDGEYDCGSAPCNWDVVYAKRITLNNTHNIGLDGDDDIYIDGTLVPDGDLNVSLGTDDKRFDTVHARDFAGRIPYPANNAAEPDVGTILLVRVTFSASIYGINIPLGVDLKYNTPNPVYGTITGIYPAYIDGSTGAFGFGPTTLNLTTGVYTTLCICGNSVSGRTDTYALVMRIL